MGLLDKRSIFIVLGNLMKKPSLLDQYNLTKDDFFEEGESTFYVIVFAAINNLYEQGITEIDIMMVDNFLSNYDVQYKIFNDNDGIEYLQNAIEQSNIHSFEYSYNRLKKFSLLREYKKAGFDIREIYDDSIIDPNESESMMTKFDQLTIDDIIYHFDKKLINIANKYRGNDEIQTIHAGKNTKKLLKRFKNEPDYGVPLIGNIQNAIFRGGKLNTLRLRSAPTNVGKTRIASAEATDMAIDEIYDLNEKKWVPHNNGEYVLFITTEEETEKLQVTMLAYIAGVPEEKIKDGKTTFEEDKRLEYAAEVLERSNFWIEYVPDFDMQLIENIIKKHIIENNVQYIYFDYIHISLSMLQELANSAKIKLREDMVLFMFMNKLDQIRKRYNVFISTSTQVNGEWKRVDNADSTILRGSKALADKATQGMIALTPTKADLEALQPIFDTGMYPNKPNIVYHIYKNRETKYKNVKLWIYIDFDTMRQEELFLTDNDYQLLPIKPIEIKSKS